MPPVDSRQLILGSAFGYSTDNIRPFLESLHQSGYAGDVVLLANSASNLDIQGYGFRANVIDVDEVLGTTAQDVQSRQPQNLEQAVARATLQQLKKTKTVGKEPAAFFYRNYYLMTSRYFLYSHFLAQWSYETVFLTDVADVVFQRNLFEQEFRDGVTAFAEHEAIPLKGEPTNRDWVAQSFGEDVLQAMGDEVVYCAGTILLKNCAQQFLQDFLKVVIEQRISPTTQGVDQAVYNYLISFLRLPYFHRKRNGDGVLTVANVPERSIHITDDGIMQKDTQDLPAVVHQYTRFQLQKDFVQRRFANL